MINMVRSNVLNGSYPLSEVGIITNPIVKDRGFLELPGFYFIKNEESMNIYKLLSSENGRR